MLLIVQIGLGIALGYALIFHHQILLHYAKKASKVLLIIAVVAAVCFGAYLAYQKISQDLKADSSQASRANETIAEFQTTSGEIVKIKAPEDYNSEELAAWAKGVVRGMEEMEFRARFAAEEQAKAARGADGKKEVINPDDVVWDDEQPKLKPWERYQSTPNTNAKP